MSRGTRRSVRAVARVAATVSLLAAASLSASAGAAQAASAPRNIQYDVPSLQGNVDEKRAQFNETGKLTAWVRLPAGYDDEPNRRWPVLYLMHGWEDNSYAWLDPKKGSIATVLPADFPGIVVMPEGARGWFINWWGSKGNPGQEWSDYLLDEVVPFFERELRIAPGRGNHAIGGLSMGGFGSVQAVGSMPTYFGHALSFSGLLDNQDLAFTNILNTAQLGWHPSYDAIFGPSNGNYASWISPRRNPLKFAGSKLTLVYGTPNINVLWSLDIRPRGLAILEIGAQGHARQFVSALKGSGAQVFTSNRANASHDWLWWKKELAAAAARGIFTPPPVKTTAENKKWTYTTMNEHGNAWGLGFQLPTRPLSEVKLVRNGDQLKATGRGPIRIAGGAADADNSGNGSDAACTFTATLPFTKTLPPSC